MVILENIDIDMDFLENIDINIPFREFCKISISIKCRIDWNLAYQKGLSYLGKIAFKNLFKILKNSDAGKKNTKTYSDEPVGR